LDIGGHGGQSLFLFHFAPFKALLFPAGLILGRMSIADRFDLLGAATGVNHKFNCLSEF
jgi:hypothetical protein